MAWNWEFEGKTLGQCGLPEAKRFNVVDERVTVLGRYADGKIAAAMKKYGDWTAVYLPTAFPQGEILDALGKIFRLHVYTDLPVNVGAGGRCVSVYCPAPSAKGEIRLPGRFSALELYSGARFASVDALPVDMTFGETRLYFLGSEREVDELANR